MIFTIGFFLFVGCWLIARMLVVFDRTWPEGCLVAVIAGYFLGGALMFVSLLYFLLPLVWEIFP